jgi:hypothetical protein
MLLSFCSISRSSQKFIRKNFYDLSPACFRKPRCEVLMAFALLSSALHPPKTGPRQRHGSTCCQTNKLVNSTSLNDTLHNTAQHLHVTKTEELSTVWQEAAGLVLQRATTCTLMRITPYGPPPPGLLAHADKSVLKMDRLS